MFRFHINSFFYLSFWRVESRIKIGANKNAIYWQTEEREENREREWENGNNIVDIAITIAEWEKTEIKLRKRAHSKNAHLNFDYSIFIYYLLINSIWIENAAQFNAIWMNIYSFIFFWNMVFYVRLGGNIYRKIDKNVPDSMIHLFINMH